jgi:hypothetical protein
VIRGGEGVADGVWRRTLNSERASKCSIASGIGEERRLEMLRASTSLQTRLCTPFSATFGQGEGTSVSSRENKVNQCRRGGAGWSGLTGFRSSCPQQWRTPVSKFAGLAVIQVGEKR